MNLKTLRLSKNLKQEDIADFLGITQPAYANYERGVRSPDPVMLGNLADYFNVTVDYLLGRTDNPAPLISTKNLTPEEKILIDKYRLLNQYGKNIVSAVVNVDPGLSSPNKNESVEKNIPTRLINLSALPVSAGVGIDVSDIDANDNPIEIVLDENSRRADYALRVTGDSMEPRFSDGDIILIRNLPCDIGSLGIFYLDGFGYFKKNGGDKLISLNHDYDDIYLNDIDTFYNQGTVLGKAVLVEQER